MNSSFSHVITQLRVQLADHEVVIDDDILIKYRTDSSGLDGELPAVLLRPSSVRSVSKAVKICAQAGQSIVTQGGLSGLAGGAIPTSTDIALSLSRFSGVEAINATAETMIVRAGTILEDAQHEAAKHGLYIPVDLGARGSATIGGMIATNAGGIRVLKHGMMRNNILGLEVVLANGTVLSNLNQLLKNNTGYDLKQLFIGSEGTLGIITRAVVKLCPIPASRQSALCAVESSEKLIRFLRLARKELAGLAAFEVMWKSFFESNQSVGKPPLFVETPTFAVIVENEILSNIGTTDVFEEFLSTALSQELISDALIAQSDSEAQMYWSIREGHRLFDAMPDLINFDISIEIDQMNGFNNELHSKIASSFPSAKIYIFGHIADSNLHIAVDIPNSDSKSEQVLDALVYGLVREFNGSVSAEHGIGLKKRAYLSCSRNQDEIDTMRLLKTALDPDDILNLGKIL